MPTPNGPEQLPVPQPTEPPDGPGAFLALITKLVVGGAIPYDNYTDMVAALGNGYSGQLATVYADPTATKNGVYWSNGSGWSLITGPRATAALGAGASGYTVGAGEVVLRGTTVFLNVQINRTSAMAAGDIVGVLPAGFRPPGSGVTALLGGASTNAGAAGPMSFQVNANGNITINAVGAGVTSGWAVGMFEIS